MACWKKKSRPALEEIEKRDIACRIPGEPYDGVSVMCLNQGAKVGELNQTDKKSRAFACF